VKLIIDIAEELKRLGVEAQRRGNSLRIRCPYHDDDNPSCDISQERQFFTCRACHVSGDAVTLVSRLAGEARHVTLSRLESLDDKPVETAAIIRYAEQIWTAKELLRQLHLRGVSDDTIKRFFLGEHNGRVTIPIANASGMYVNIRQYAPGEKLAPKTLNLKGRGAARIYPFEQLQYPRILFTGGEIKALAGLERLNEHGIGCVTLTAGENEWAPKFEEYFRGKQVWMGLDIDTTGKRAAEYRCARLQNMASWVGNVDWPLDISKYPNGDLNDAIAEGVDLLALLEATPQWVSTLRGVVATGDDEEELSEISIKDAMQASMATKRFKSRVVVTAVAQDPFYAPKEVIPVCTRDQTFCSACPVFLSQPESAMTIHPESTSIVAIMNGGDENLVKEIGKALGVPDCPIVKYDITNRYKVQEARVQRALNLTAQDSDKMAVSTIMVDRETELNETYEITGRSIPHPRTQRCVAVVSNTTAVADALTGFELTKPEELERFRPREWSVESIDEVLDPIYEELSRNVTRIYERKTLHQLIDLAYHSALAFNVRGVSQKGVAEILVVGDRGQGKSETAQNLQRFYGLGERVDCKNATVAGLLGGLEQIGGTWFIHWGVIPQHDRRLVILEELKGMREDVFSKLTDMRSSGEAELPKIIRQKAQARTRLVVLSNARSDRGIEAYPYGVDAVVELIGAAEDIRRFDVCMVLTRKDVDHNVIHEIRENAPETFTAEQARRLVLWCWTRDISKIDVSDETVAMAVAQSKLLCDEFTDSVPLFDHGGARFKLLRLACAVAGRTYSTDPSYERLIVRPCHVEWVAKFLRDEYTRPTHGYSALTERARRQENLVDKEAVTTQLAVLPNVKSTLEQLLHTDELEAKDLCDWCGWQTEEANIAIGKLVQNNALTRKGRSYQKTPPFVNMLRHLVANPPERPEHLNGHAQY